MAIHAKSNGLLIGGSVIEEGNSFWCFHAIDNKRPTYIEKSDLNNKVFDGPTAVEDAINWQDSVRNKKLKGK